MRRSVPSGAAIVPLSLMSAMRPCQGLRPAVTGDVAGQPVGAVDQILENSRGAAGRDEGPARLGTIGEWRFFGSFVGHVLFFPSFPSMPPRKAAAMRRGAARGLEARRARRSRGFGRSGREERRGPEPPPFGCQLPKASNSAAAERRWVLEGAAWGAS